MAYKFKLPEKVETNFLTIKTTSEKGANKFQKFICWLFVITPLLHYKYEATFIAAKIRKGSAYLSYLYVGDLLKDVYGNIWEINTIAGSDAVSDVVTITTTKWVFPIKEFKVLYFLNSNF